MVTTAPVLVGVLAVQGDVREHVAALERSGAAVRRVRRPEELEGLDGLVVPGGESTTIDRLARIFGLHEPVRALVRAGLPVYGSCAGMIQLADQILDGHAEQQTFGGIDMTVRRNAFGRQVDSFEAGLVVPALLEPERPFPAVFIRAPRVEHHGPGVQVLARVDDAVVAVRQGNLLATSFHPEVSGDDRVHQLFVRICCAHHAAVRPTVATAS
ncbi:pyridoxal 5'-phosphate synthase glutaminase subunit PdxT [Ornithinimicrobium avium]|uniref:Pyridoxal 5'-phosphate synthase subunit PdxT n=1 Tax=Ornithinimicrobium avium TaxID=2283195 RepID=A0A345NJU4_9MICO|nr:pyridoxal 5'-phosphate synthase glutaminase subunit PdxT [Ornithinimicrobium avium]AXH95302.1 pyridoxal 5'-phosphate synthase glutaminase subunit PdxT [Ornithinimicrobium avium]